MNSEIYDKLLNKDSSFVCSLSPMSESTGIMLSTLWNQSGVARVGNNTTITYNEYCPYVSGTTHSVTGCTNTAAGQIIYYFIENSDLELQLTLSSDDAYTDGNGLSVNADGSTPGTVSFSVINSKLAHYDLNSADDAAALLYACGVVQKATYGSSTSTAWNEQLFYRAGFECVNNVYTSWSSCWYWGTQGNISEGGFEVLIENLQAGRVVGTSFPGHAVVIDGYNPEDDTFHINYGWGEYASQTRWYTREEMNEDEYYQFLYDLMVEGDETVFVTDSDVYGTGTLIRAFELANGIKGANTISFDGMIAGEDIQLPDYLSFKEETVVSNFNVDLMVTNDSGWTAGFYCRSGAALDFNDFSGSLIVNTTSGDGSAYAFNVSGSSSFSLDAEGAVIYAGKHSSAQEVLTSLQAAQREHSELYPRKYAEQWQLLCCKRF